MKIIQSFLTQNRCYIANKKINVKGIMLHSVGIDQPKASTFVTGWNKSSVGVCVHAFVDGLTGDVYQTLPWDHRGWHCGGDGNNTHISVEMCEPADIRYTGSGATLTYSQADKDEIVATVYKTYNSSVELFAMLCKEYGLNPLDSDVVLSHSEGYKKGIASNHADPNHLWEQLGLPLTMDTFRRDVYNKMSGINSTIEPEQETEEQEQDNTTTDLKVPFKVQVLINNLNYRSTPSNSGAVKGQTGKGIFTIVETQNGWGKLSSGAGWIYLENEDYCKILAETAPQEPETSTKYLVRVTVSALNIRKEPSTVAAITGCIRNKGVYTIVDEVDGWGKLSSGAGWIYLSFTEKV